MENIRQIELSNKTVVTVEYTGRNLHQPEAVATFEGANHSTLAEAFITAISNPCAKCGGYLGKHQQLYIIDRNGDGTGSVEGHYEDCPLKNDPYAVLAAAYGSQQNPKKQFKFPKGD